MLSLSRLGQSIRDVFLVVEEEEDFMGVRVAGRGRAGKRSEDSHETGRTTFVIDPFPEKPKRMRWATYGRLIEKAKEAELERLKALGIHHGE